MSPSMPRRTTAKPLAVAAAVAVVLTVQIAVAGAAEAAPNRGTPAVTTQRMTDATLHSTQHGTYAKGGALVLECYERGQSVKGAFSPWIPGGWDNLWYRVDDGHYVADVDLSTGSNDPVTGPCSQPPRASGGVVGDDYPATWKNLPLDGAVDDWGYYTRECTSFVAHRLAAKNGFTMPRAIGWAGAWGGQLQARGYRVDSSPRVGSIAWDPAGHVAWVAKVGDGVVTVEEYNYGYTGQYHSRTVSTGTFQYIHVKDL